MSENVEKILHRFTANELMFIREQQTRMNIILETMARANGINEPCGISSDGSSIVATNPAEMMMKAMVKSNG